MALNAKLDIETEWRNGKTILKKSFCTPPFKIADITENKKHSGLTLMLMSSSPGVLDGDEYHLQIDVAEECSLELQTQSYHRLFQMQKGARQFLQVNLKAGASLTYIPHPIVPHENSMFFSKSIIVMDETSSLTWGEVMTCGRSLNGEVFKFSSYHNTTEIFFGEKLVVKENILMKPAELNPGSIGQLEGYTHQTNLLFIDQYINTIESTQSVIEFLKHQDKIEFGISALPVNGLIVRLLGFKSEQLFDLLKNLSAILSHKPVNEKLHVG